MPRLVATGSAHSIQFVRREPDLASGLEVDFGGPPELGLLPKPEARPHEDEDGHADEDHEEVLGALSGRGGF